MHKAFRAIRAQLALQEPRVFRAIRAQLVQQALHQQLQVQREQQAPLVHKVTLARLALKVFKV